MLFVVIDNIIFKPPLYKNVNAPLLHTRMYIIIRIRPSRNNDPKINIFEIAYCTIQKCAYLNQYSGNSLNVVNTV